MGLALAERLVRSGHHVTVYERAEQTGGLATGHDFGSFNWDRFYHVVLPSDTSLIDSCAGSGSRTSSLARRRPTVSTSISLYSLSSGLEFLKFPLLNLFGQAPSGARRSCTARASTTGAVWRGMTVVELLVRVSGRATFEKMWQPLLLAKLGENYGRVSAVFIWTYIKRLFSARDGAAQKRAPRLRFRAATGRSSAHLLELIEQGGGRRSEAASKWRASGRSRGRGIAVVRLRPSRGFDKVICTGPVQVLRRVADAALVAAPLAGDVEYLGVVCVALVTQRAVRALSTS